MAERIVILSHSSHWYGAERCLHRLLASLDRTRFDPLVLFPEEGPLAQAVRAMGIEVSLRAVEPWISVAGFDPSRRARFLEGLPDRVEALSEILHREGAALALTNSSIIADLALAADRDGVPHLWWIHELLSFQPGLVPLVAPSAFLSAVDGTRGRFVVVSQRLAQLWSGFVDPARVRVIHNGIPASRPSGPVDKTALLGVDEAAPVISFVGTLTLNKGPLYLANAAERVHRRFPEARFTLTGPDGGQLSAVQAKVNQLGIAPAFRFLGYRTDVLEIMAASDIFVLPSIVDSFPTVILEAMGAGLPVVASRSGGAEEMIVDGETGYLFDVGDVEAMADRICRLLAAPLPARRMGERARERAQRLFSADRFQSAMESLLTEMISARTWPSGRSAGFSESHRTPTRSSP